MKRQGIMVRREERGDSVVDAMSCVGVMGRRLWK